MFMCRSTWYMCICCHTLLNMCSIDDTYMYVMLKQRKPYSRIWMRQAAKEDYAVRRNKKSREQQNCKYASRRQGPNERLSVLIDKWLSAFFAVCCCVRFFLLRQIADQIDDLWIYCLCIVHSLNVLSVFASIFIHCFRFDWRLNCPGNVIYPIVHVSYRWLATYT